MTKYYICLKLSVGGISQKQLALYTSSLFIKLVTNHSHSVNEDINTLAKKLLNSINEDIYTAENDVLLWVEEHWWTLQCLELFLVYILYFCILNLHNLLEIK